MKSRFSMYFFIITLVFTCLSVGLLMYFSKHPGRKTPAREARAIWLHRFEYTGYTRTHDQDSIKQYIRQTIKNAADANFNLILFQVRGNGDAYYTPGFEPWGELLTGTPGKDPGWDPLQYAIDQAHARGLELHAWINTFPAWRGRTLPPETTPPAAILEHPEWIVCDSAGNPMPLSDHYITFSPGIPAVQDYLIKVVTDIEQRYDVDGIHFDYIRYPEEAPRRGYSHDFISVKRFQSEEGNPYHLEWEDWQREQLNHFVYRMYDAITRIKPWVKMSASVIGNYNQSGWNAYYAVYQDPRRWTEMEKIDFIIPMSYLNPGYFDQVIADWKNYNTIDRPVFPGIGSYRFTPRRHLKWDMTLQEMGAVRAHQINGMSFFDASSLRNHWNTIRTHYFRHPANLPAMPWKKNAVPSAPENIQVLGYPDSTVITWNAGAETPEDPVRVFTVYATPGTSIDSTNGMQVQAILPGNQFRWVTRCPACIDPGWQFGVTAVDRYGNESRLTLSAKRQKNL